MREGKKEGDVLNSKTAIHFSLLLSYWQLGAIVLFMNNDIKMSKQNSEYMRTFTIE